MNAVKWIGTLLAGGILVAVAARLTVAAMAPTPAPPRYARADFPPPSVNCQSADANLPDCTMLLAADPADYGITFADIRTLVGHAWCAGLAKRTDGARPGAWIRVIAPDGTVYGNVDISPDTCQ